VTDSEHIARILDGLSELGCGNHSCYFNPPQGVGTTGGCDCLNGLPFPLRKALIGCGWIGVAINAGVIPLTDS